MNEIEKIQNASTSTDDKGTFVWLNRKEINIILQALQEKAERENTKSAKWITWEEKFPDTKPPKENSLGVFCTACGLHSDNMYSFCPNCGAKMNDHIGEANGMVKEEK